MEFYLGEPLGNEVDGRSAFVSTDVQDTIESVMPDLVQLFTVGDDVVLCEPESQEDEAVAKQASDYLNHIWNKDNPGFNLFHDWFKDSLMQINGFLKVYWDDSEERTVHHFTGLTDAEYTMLLTNDDENNEIEITEHSEYTEGVENIIAMDGFAPVMHDVKFDRIRKKGRVKIETIPPEEFLIERRARNIEDASFVAHKVRMTASDLIEMGFDPETIRNMPSTDEQEYNQERVARFNRDDEWPYDEDYPDESTREIWVYDAYIKVDWNGDGVAELRRLMAAGPGYEILLNEEASMMPFVSISPIRMPHKFYGRSLSELVEDLQVIKSTLVRQLLDNLYQINNARTAISNQVDIDDALTNRVGGIIRVETDSADVQGHMVPVVTAPIAQDVLPMLEYIDTVRETRSGVTRYGQGVDPDALNTTASGMNMLLGRQQQRILLIGRVFAEGGVRDAFKKILRLVIENQDKARLIRLRNEWVPMDPASWNADMDINIQVGIGHGTREQKMVSLRMLLDLMERAVVHQGGAQGPLIDLEGLYNAAKKFIEELGFDADLFLNDPSTPEAQRMMQMMASQPNPEVQKEQMKAQLEERKIGQQGEVDMAKLAAQDRKTQAEIELKRELAIAQFQLDVWKAETEAGLKREEFDLQAALAEMKEGGEREREEMRSQASEKQSPVSVQYGSGDEMANFLGSMKEVAEGMKTSSDAMKDAVDAMTAPKEITRDAQGRPSGIRVAS